MTTLKHERAKTRRILTRSRFNDDDRFGSRRARCRTAQCRAEKTSRAARSRFHADRFRCRLKLGGSGCETWPVAFVFLVTGDFAFLHSAGCGGDLPEPSHAARRWNLSVGQARV